MIHGIRKSDKHSYYDFGLIMIDRTIETPSKNKIKVNIPYTNGYYDFSNLYGEATYEERKLTYKFRLKGSNIKSVNNKYTNILKWLTDGKQEPLFDDLFKGYYFLAECEGDVNFKELDTNKKFATIEVTFNAYPFKISTMQDGHDTWDDFNFELDMVQDTKFIVNGTQSVKLYNNGSIAINPTIVCSSDMQIKKGSNIYNFKQGTSKSIFKLDKGLNDLIIIGNGTIEFKWYKELL